MNSIVIKTSFNKKKDFLILLILLSISISLLFFFFSELLLWLSYSDRLLLDCIIFQKKILKNV